MDFVQFVPGIYVVGVLVGLWRVAAPPAERLGWALLWPIGPAAFVITVTVLLAAGLFVLVTSPFARRSA